MFTTRPELAGTFGMVASTHWLASAAGMAVLEAGGNAFDAAVAAGFTLQVVEPHLNGPGGEVPILFARGGSDPDAGRPVLLSGQGIAPAGATIEAFEQLGLDLVPGTGLLAATVPGAVCAWLTLLRDHGTQPLDAVLRYAIEYAGTGHPLLPRVTATVASVSEHFRTSWPTSAATWLTSDGAPPDAGRLFRNSVLASTYRRLLSAARGPSREAQIDAAMAAWSQGFVAEAIDRFSRYPVQDDSGRAHPGFLTGDDLAGWTPTYEPPVTLDRQGWTLAKAGPWSQGPALLQALAMLDDVPPAGTDRVHASVEAVKLAMADREAWYGDVDDVPVDDLLSSTYATERRALIGSTASRALRPGSPGGRPPRLPSLLSREGAPHHPAGPGTGEPTISRSGTTRGDTCHVDVVDRWGNLVSATPSGGWLQSSPVVPELGFPLGTRAQMFWLERGLPNSLAPGKRPRTTLTPSLALRDDEPVLAFGTPGGDQQEQWQLCFWLAHAVDGLDLQAAIDAPAWHTTAFPSSFFPRDMTSGEVVVESRIGDDVVAGLRGRGHDVTVSGPWTLGRLSAVSRDPRTGILRAAADARGMQGYAAGR
ncbi:gamma-glutamyltransferase family protein [Blastococcus sp. CT_GayMR20]|uniref:gamma-glutamyltransferase family protein n=1 Tax=Blastococcus sp. CT_GayMR20 TaxID=2559609 RepID=UPI0010747960|nr:gamma-glutamyltransferase [Blastococcus sp. CT_GayMR20]TFV89720.1 gamma-glutamyltransferase family protein [Blastococcus sp. CT_GayMR20]TFV89755.1 gamma-glutamyltransferase family protein [Blastococcus sp. CT_GayMR20]